MWCCYCCSQCQCWVMATIAESDDCHVIDVLWPCHLNCIHYVFFPLILTPLLLLLLFSSFRYSVHLVFIFFSSSHFFLSPTDCLLHRWSRKSQNWWWKHCVCVNLVVPAPRCKSNLSQNSSWSSGLVVSTTDWPHSITTLSATRYIPMQSWLVLIYKDNLHFLFFTVVNTDCFSVFLYYPFTFIYLGLCTLYLYTFNVVFSHRLSIRLRRQFAL